MNTRLLLENALYFLALVNPASKIFLLSSWAPPLSKPDLRRLSLQSTLAAFLILCVLTAAGDFLLHHVFRIEIYSLKVAGGLVLFLVGITAVRQGRFYEKEENPSLAGLSIVPLGAPLIAGPGTIAAAISFASEQGVGATLLPLSLALLANLALMLLSRRIGGLLERLHATGPLIRITGLVVAAVAVQMILNGLAEWRLATP